MASASVADARRTALYAGASLGLIAFVDVLNLSAPLAAVVLAAIVALAYREPLGGMSATLFALPWFFHPIGIGAKQFPASELLLFCCALGVGAAMIYDAARSHAGRVWLARFTRAWLSSPLLWSALILTSVGLVLALRPFDLSHRSDSLREWRWTLLEPLLLLCLLTAVSDDRPRATRTLAVALVGGATVAALQAIFDLVIGGGIQVEGVTRIVGPYPHPNALALYTTRVVSFALAWLVLDPRSRRWLGAAVLLGGAATVASFSRGALVALAASSSLLLPTIERRLRLMAIAGTILAAAALVLVEHDRMLDLFGGGSGSLRLDIWRSAIEMIRDQPFKGYGPDQFLYAYVPRYIEPTGWDERFTAHAHNLILDFWIRLGIIGGAFAIVAITSGTLRAYHVVVARRATRFDMLTVAGSVALVAALLHGLVDNAYFSHDLAMSGWFLAWLAFAPATTRRAEGRTTSARSRRWRSWIHRLTPVR